jgi:hypothetical protein
VSTPNTHDQTQHLAQEMSHWLALFDQDLALEDVPLSQRPFHALMKLFLNDAFEMRVGDRKVNLENPSEHVNELWFKALYAAVERWYVNAFGPEAVRAKGNPPLEGVVLIRGVPYAMKVPTSRVKVEVAGKQA